MPKPKVIPAPAPAEMAAIEATSRYEQTLQALPDDVRQAAQVLEQLGLPVEFAVRDYVLAHETETGALEQAEATEAHQQLLAQDAEERAQAKLAAAHQNDLLAVALKNNLVAIGQPEATEPEGAKLIQNSALYSLVQVAALNPWNKPYAGKLVAAHDLGPLGQVLVSHLRQRGVTAVCLAGGVIAGELRGAIHVLSETEVEYLERNLSPELLARLAWLQTNPTEATTVAVPASAPAAGAAGKYFKHRAKAGRKVARKQVLRGMLAADLGKQVAQKSKPPIYQGIHPYPQQAPPTSAPTCPPAGAIPPLPTASCCAGSPGLVPSGCGTCDTCPGPGPDLFTQPTLTPAQAVKNALR